MSALIGNPLLLTSAPSGADAYEIENSLRFYTADSARLNFTPSSNGNRKTWTYSTWLKTGTVTSSSNTRRLFSADGVAGVGTGNDNRLHFNIGVDGKLACGNGAVNFFFSTATFKDPSAWYHIVMAVDTTQAMNNERISVYANGRLVAWNGSYGGSSVSQNTDLAISKSGREMDIGRGENQLADQYLADTYFIDGLKLSPYSFGKFDSTGVWTAKALAFPTPNDDQGNPTYTNDGDPGVSIQGGWDASYPKTNLFDGNDTTYGGHGTEANNNTMGIQFATAIPKYSSVRIKRNYTASTVEYKLEDGDGNWGKYFPSVDENGEVWEDITDYVPFNGLTGIIFRVTSGNQNKFYVGAIEVDGVLLKDNHTDQTFEGWVDSNTDHVNSFHLKYNDTSTNAALGTDSLKSNNWSVTNLTETDGVVKVDDATAAIPIYTTTNDGDTVPDLADYRTDSAASNIVLAVPGNVLTDQHAGVKGSGSAKTVTASGAVTSTTESRFYGTSVKFADDGSNDVLSIANNEDLCDFGTGNFTMEAWLRPTKSNDSMFVMGCSKNGSNPNRRGPMIFISSSADNEVRFEYSTGSTHAAYINDGSKGATQDEWTHVAVVRNGNDCKLYINGTQDGSTLDVSSIATAADNDDDPFTIGHNSDQTWGAYDGYMQDVRVYKGAAKYTANFSPPSRGAPTELDVFTDSPTAYGSDGGKGGEVRGNYPVLTPLIPQPTGGSLSQGNLTIQTDANGEFKGYSTMAIPANTGKWYFEVTVETKGNDSQHSLYQTDAATAGPTMQFREGVSGDIFGYAIDQTAGTWVKYKNGSQDGNGTQDKTYEWLLRVYDYQGSAKHTVNFGQRKFSYAAPAGFKCLCSKNLPDTFSGDELNNPTKFFDCKPGPTSGENWNFGPDFVWTKRRDTSNGHTWMDVVRGVTKRLDSEGNYADGTTTTAITSFDSDGFTLGANVNTAGNSLAAWGWDAGTAAITPSSSYNITPSAQWANTTAGFSITKYAGNGSDNQTLPHALGAVPQFVMIKNLSEAVNWNVKHHKLSSNKILYLDQTGGEDGATGSQHGNPADLDSNVTVTLTTNSTNFKNVNESGDDYIMYAWTGIPGFSKFGSWSGNGGKNFLYLGFQPSMIFWKCSSDSSDWEIFDTKRLGYNPDNKLLYPNYSNSEAGSGVTPHFMSNGIRFTGGNNHCNGSGRTFVYAAWAVHPFKTSRAR